MSFKKPPYKKEDWISRDEACELLNVKKTSLCNMVTKGTIPAKFISVGVGNNKFFYRPGLIGFDN